MDMPAHFQQSDFWCAFKCAHGWHCLSRDGVRVLYRTFRKGPLSFSIAYVPLAPEYDSSDARMRDDAGYMRRIGAFSGEIMPLLPPDTLFVRYDIPLEFSSADERDGYAARVPEIAGSAHVRIRKAASDVQPPDSVVLDLARSEEEILSAMKSKWRYNIRYAKKHGVEVRAVRAGDGTFERDVQSFYGLYRTTAERDGIGIHPLSYYRDLLERGSSSDAADVTLYIASHEGEDLAAIITLFLGREAVYLYGCSGNSKRNLMPAYLVQWIAITDAKQYGAEVYDFYGIPPTGDERHPMHGLYLFKTGFGGREIHRPGSFDVPVGTFYWLYVLAEKARAFWHKTVMKKIRGR